MKRYHFVPGNDRKSWADEFEAMRQKDYSNNVTSSVDDYFEFEDARLFPYPVAITVSEVFLDDEKGDWYGSMDSIFINARPTPKVSALDIIVSVDCIQNEIFLLSNARIHGYYHPDLSGEIHNLQYSVDLMRATKGFSTETWMQRLGFNIETDDDETEASREDENSTVSEEGIALPFAYIAPFSLALVLKGFVGTKTPQQSAMRVDSFIGTEKTTSNNLIMYFVKTVLARTPGLLTNSNILGMGVGDLAGVGSGMTIGAAIVPGGQYIALLVIAASDFVNGTIEAGKEARNKPGDKFQPGDMIRGIVYGAKEMTRKGALRRGKSYHDLYDEEDRVKVDPLDFAVGATEATGSYLDNNKARFIGATVGCVATISLGVFLTPWVGIAAGVLAGQVTTVCINRTEKFIKKKKAEAEKNRRMDSTDVEHKSRRSFHERETPPRTGQKKKTDQRNNRLKRRTNAKK
jgi:hypothetical protein